MRLPAAPRAGPRTSPRRCHPRRWHPAASPRSSARGARASRPRLRRPGGWSAPRTGSARSWPDPRDARWTRGENASRSGNTSRARRRSSRPSSSPPPRRRRSPSPRASPRRESSSRTQLARDSSVGRFRGNRRARKPPGPGASWPRRRRTATGAGPCARPRWTTSARGSGTRRRTPRTWPRRASPRAPRRMSDWSRSFASASSVNTPRRTRTRRPSRRSPPRGTSPCCCTATRSTARTSVRGGTTRR